MSIIYAHRGASGHAPENTLEAFALAMEMGTDGFELDVHLSSAGELVVIHDEKVDRTTNGTGYVKDLTLAQLKALDASNGMEKYKGAKIPSLAEVYALIKDTDIVVNVEVKTDGILYPDIEAKCLKLEREMGMTGRILYSSFNHYTIAELRRQDPDAKLALLYMSGLYQPWNYAKMVGADFIHPYFPSMFLPGLPEGCAASGIGCNLWTVDDPEIMKQCLALNLGIITDYPDVAVALRDGK